MKIIIEDNVPIERSNNEYKVAMQNMNVGQSFKFPIQDRNKVNSWAYHIKPGGFKIRKISETECRVWKV